MQCESCGTTKNVSQVRYIWEFPPGCGDKDEREYLDQTPLRTVCMACCEAAAVAHLAAHPFSPDDVLSCPRCEHPNRRGDLILVATKTGAAQMCPSCAVGGRLPWEARGQA